LLLFSANASPCALLLVGNFTRPQLEAAGLIAANNDGRVGGQGINPGSDDEDEDDLGNINDAENPPPPIPTPREPEAPTADEVADEVVENPQDNGQFGTMTFEYGCISIPNCLDRDGQYRTMFLCYLYGPTGVQTVQSTLHPNFSGLEYKFYVPTRAFDARLVLGDIVDAPRMEKVFDGVATYMTQKIQASPLEAQRVPRTCFVEFPSKSVDYLVNPRNADSRDVVQKSIVVGGVIFFWTATYSATTQPRAQSLADDPR
jgi:hypothetical protein